MNRVAQLFDIRYPIIQAGMIWCSGWQLAAAVSNAGGLGIIGAGSMYPHILEEHLAKCNAATQKPYAVNIPLLYSDIAQHIDLIRRYSVPIVFTSAGNPKTWTSRLKEDGIKVVHVVSSAAFAQKAEAAGVDAVVAVVARVLVAGRRAQHEADAILRFEQQRAANAIFADAAKPEHWPRVELAFE